MEKNELIALLLLLMLGLSLRLAGSQLFPLWGGPDEGSHFYHVLYIAEFGKMPNMPLEAVENTLYNQTVGQPPLYYWLLAPTYSTVKGFGVEAAVHLLRLFNVFFGMACIALTFLIAKSLKLGRRISIASAALIALLPTHVVVSSGVTNDPLSWLFGLGSTYFAVMAFREKKARPLAFSGLLLAAAMLTKFNTMALAIPFLAAGIMVLIKGRERAWKRFVSFISPVLSVPVFVRNLLVTGDALYPRTRNLALGLPWLAYFTVHFFPGIWLQEYGTSTIPEYRMAFFAFYAVVSLAAFLGFLGIMTGKGVESKNRLEIVLLLMLPTILCIAGLVYINTYGLWVDARLIFPTISLFAIMLVAGLQHFTKIIKKPGLSAPLIWFFLFTLLVLDIIVLLSHNKVLPDVPWVVP